MAIITFLAGTGHSAGTTLTTEDITIDLASVKISAKHTVADLRTGWRIDNLVRDGNAARAESVLVFQMEPNSIFQTQFSNGTITFPPSQPRYIAITGSDTPQNTALSANNTGVFDTINIGGIVGGDAADLHETMQTVAANRGTILGLNTNVLLNWDRIDDNSGYFYFTGDAVDQLGFLNGGHNSAIAQGWDLDVATIRAGRFYPAGTEPATVTGVEGLVSLTPAAYDTFLSVLPPSQYGIVAT